MKNTIYLISALVMGIMLNSCEDFLDRTPLDQISDPEFWKTETDLELYINGLYEYFEGYATVGMGGGWTKDCGTDIVLEKVGAYWDTYTQRLDGTLTVPSSGGGWNWSKIREVNHFLENAGLVEEGDLLDHYTGEGHFFRAWFYFELLVKFGDLPIITETVNADNEELLYGSRSSRSDVLDFMIIDLDSAISKMKLASEVGPSRLNRDIAALFKARVCLYEGTWEKYHLGTDFEGKTDGTDFLMAAADAANEVIEAGNYSLETGDINSAYYELFNQTDYSKNKEVMLYKHQDYLAYGNQFGNQSQNWPNGYGISHEMTQMYLCSDGLPIGISPLFQGDSTLYQVEINRDPRCAQTIMVPGDIIAINQEDTTFFNLPEVFNCPTGYESEKFRRPQYDAESGSPSHDVGYIFFRYAEALLVYAEAKAELGTLNQADLDKTINKLRDRVGMPHLTLGSIAEDPNWPDYGHSLPDYVYEIRRERAVELYGEGFRFDDLMRWRAHDLWLGKRFTGTLYTDELKELDPNMFANEEGYLDPFQVILNGPDGGYGFHEDRDYLLPIPINELTLNDNLDQNPNW